MGFIRDLIAKIRGLFGSVSSGSDFLCDSCKYDHPSACQRPERPNARQCPDYRRR